MCTYGICVTRSAILSRRSSERCGVSVTLLIPRIRMNSRSIRFRLTVWYAGLLTFLLALFGGVIYFTLERFLDRNLAETLAKDAQTIGDSWLRDVHQTGLSYVAGEIEE